MYLHGDEELAYSRALLVDRMTTCICTYCCFNVEILCFSDLPILMRYQFNIRVIFTAMENGIERKRYRRI